MSFPRPLEQMFCPDCTHPSVRHDEEGVCLVCREEWLDRNRRFKDICTLSRAEGCDCDMSTSATARHWIEEAEPTESEVEAAAKVLDPDAWNMDPGDYLDDYQRVRDTNNAEGFQYKARQRSLRAARAALKAAREVRAEG